MLSLNEVRTPGQADQFYREVIRNLSIEDIQHIQKEGLSAEERADPGNFKMQVAETAWKKFVELDAEAQTAH